MGPACRLKVRVQATLTWCERPVVDVPFFDVPSTGDVDRDDGLVGLFESSDDLVKRRSGFSFEGKAKDGVHHDVMVGEGVFEGFLWGSAATTAAVILLVGSTNLGNGQVQTLLAQLLVEFVLACLGIEESPVECRGQRRVGAGADEGRQTAGFHQLGTFKQ